jgi:hypothetical protein
MASQICPAIPAEITTASEALADAYLKSSICPRLAKRVLVHWDNLIDEWADKSDLPLFIRKQQADCGDFLLHPASGRQLAPCDNSPAHWAILTAFSKGTGITLGDVRAAIAAHKIAACMVMSNAEAEQAELKGVGQKLPNAFKLGWRVDHIVDVGLKQRKRIVDFDITALKAHFQRLMKLSNIILVPSALRGLGDMPALSERLHKHS